MDLESELSIKEFRLGTRRIRAQAKRIYSNRHVFRLELTVSPVTSWVTSWVPQFFQPVLPEWFLPPVMILKERNPLKPEEYRNEVEKYKQLRSLQGDVIPRFYGETISDDHTPAILLEFIEGTPLHKLPEEDLFSQPILTAHHDRLPLYDLRRDDIPNPQLLSKLQYMYDQFTRNGVVHGDPKLHNFIHSDHGVVAIDLEFSHLLPHDVTNKHELASLIDEIGAIIDVSSLVQYKPHVPQLSFMIGGRSRHLDSTLNN
ncbi:hypothetical protein F5Y17DRAFT_470513 [Xylariaceae sp. FL0594]|nr:hypothetical protein F5Y17DRAFT_470513 [Xylariaceae sp. FL0594]